MQKFHCPHCDQELSAEVADAGSRTACPSCGEVLEIPEIGSESAPPYPGPDDDGAYAPPKALKWKVVKGLRDGFDGLKLRSKQAGLKARLEKLRNVDLRKAHYALGLDCFESGHLEEELGDRFQEIRELDQQIALKRTAMEHDEGETRVAAAKRLAKEAAKSAHAQTLAVKRRQLLTQIGELAHSKLHDFAAPEFVSHVSAINGIKEQIKNLDVAIGTTGEAARHFNRQLIIGLGSVLIIVAVAFALRFGSSSQGAASSSADGSASGPFAPADDELEVVQYQPWTASSDELVEMGLSFFKGEGRPKDEARAASLFLEAAKGGSAAGQYFVADCYHHGWGLDEDRVEAIRWYRKASEQGFAPATFALGECYYWGHGVTKDESRALDCFLRAEPDLPEPQKTRCGNRIRTLRGG